MNKVSIGIATLSLAFAGAVFSQAADTTTAAKSPDVHAGIKADFGSIDKDKDGRVSKAEAQSYSELTTSFGTLDTDSDTYLSQTEFGKWKAPAPAMSAPDAGKTVTPAK